jgi:hypothetical protein
MAERISDKKQFAVKMMDRADMVAEGVDLKVRGKTVFGS